MSKKDFEHRRETFSVITPFSLGKKIMECPLSPLSLVALIPLRKLPVNLSSGCLKKAPHIFWSFLLDIQLHFSLYSIHPKTSSYHYFKGHITIAVHVPDQEHGFIGINVTETETGILAEKDERYWIDLSRWRVG